MSGTPKRLAGPAYLSNSAANIFQGAGGNAAMVDKITHIHLVNETSSDVTVSLYIGGTGGSTGGTSLAKGKTVKANDFVDLYLSTPIASTEYLTGLCSASNACAITVDGERSVVP